MIERHIQIVRSFIDRQKLSAETEVVQCDQQGSEKTYFLKQVLSTGHRYVDTWAYL